MKTTSLLTVVLLFSIHVFAQKEKNIDNELEVTALTGYEYNYFKSPSKVIFNDILLTEDDLVASSPFQNIDLNYDYKRKWNGNKIWLSASPEFRYFNENADDSYWSLKIKGRYDYRITKALKLDTDIYFRRMAREGLDGDQDVLINPLGYSLLGGSAGLDLDIGRDIQMEVAAFFNHKNYDKYGVKDLKYNEFGVDFNIQQEFELLKTKHELGLSTYLKKRLYETYDAFDEEPYGTRDWNYWKGELFYKTNLTKRLEFDTDFAYLIRTDLGANRSGYEQYGVSLGLDYENKRLDIGLGAELLNRKYTAISARDNEGQIGEMTKYKYLNLSFDIQYSLSKHFTVSAEAYQRVRNTNYTDLSARSFRGFTYQFAGLGVIYEL